MNCKDCVYSDIADWEQNEKTGKATPIFWCCKFKSTCEDVATCTIFDNGEVEKMKELKFIITEK